MFYDNYVRLCNSVNKTPSAVALEIGIAKPTVSRWKTGSKPNHATAMKVADYFGVSVDELEGKGAKKEPTGNADGLTEEELKFIEWYRSQATEKEKALVKMIVEGEK